MISNKTILKKKHTVGILLSLSSAVLGMFRDIILIYLLGFNKLNDLLQIYLSVYFVIGLLIDPLRLTYLNLISVRSFKQLLCLFLSVIFVFMLFFIWLLLSVNPALNQHYVILAAIDGCLGVFVALFVFHKQRFGAYLSSQIVSVFPSFIMIPAIIVLAYLPHHLFIVYFLLMFLVVHMLQLLLLTFINIPKQAIKKESIRLNDLLFLGSHCISVFGEQLFQIVARLIFFQVGQGFTTLISLFMKCLTTLRFVFVDSYIGTKLSTWSLEHSKDVFFVLLNNQKLNLIIVLCAFFICFFDKSNFYLIGAQLFTIGLMSFYLSSLHRIMYFKWNHHSHNRMLIVLTGLTDLSTALFLLLCFQFHMKNHVMLFIYAWYIVRLYLEFSFLRAYLNKFHLETALDKSNLAINS